MVSIVYWRKYKKQNKGLKVKTKERKRCMQEVGHFEGSLKRRLLTVQVGTALRKNREH